MKMEQWERKLEALRKYGRIRTEPWATEEDIRRFQEESGIALPEQYREWLRLSDGGRLFPPAALQLYGVAHKPVICAAEEAALGSGYAVVGAMPYGDPVLFRSGSEAFMLYNQEAQRIEPEEVFPDFAAFLDHVPALLGLEG